MAEWEERLREVLEKLSPREREILLLGHDDQLSDEERAKILGMSAGTFKALHARLVKRVEAALGGPGALGNLRDHVNLDDEEAPINRIAPYLDPDPIFDVSGKIGTGPGAPEDHLSEHLRRVLEKMKPQDREILLLRHFERLSNAECAKVLGLTPRAVATRHLRAARRLRAMLTRGGDDDPGSAGVPARLRPGPGLDGGHAEPEVEEEDEQEDEAT